MSVFTWLQLRFELRRGPEHRGKELWIAWWEYSGNKQRDKVQASRNTVQPLNGWFKWKQSELYDKGFLGEVWCRVGEWVDEAGGDLWG